LIFLKSSIPPLGTTNQLSWFNKNLRVASGHFLLRRRCNLIATACGKKALTTSLCRLQRAPIGRIAGRKWSHRWTVRRETALAHMPEPASTTSTKGFERPIGKEDLAASARHRVDIEHRQVPALFAHAAAPVGSERANPRK
jgi:hypothetical protein